MRHFLLLFACLGVISGCSNEKPRPEGKIEVNPLQITVLREEALEVVSLDQKRVMTVNHHIKGNNVYVECFVSNFSFKGNKQTKKNGEGYLNVYVDGKKVDEIATAAFVIKGLENGAHTIKIELVHNDSTSYHIKKTWKVEI
ncbi:hypothetical protein ACFFIX_06845 [Metabacillus herbersteinensis]|uniref:Lipoprotein n=1 Tax=Metabacillus herbersteinensis TaxID=283816 RepID=A0ABV6GBW8_9BACI